MTKKQCLLKISKYAVIGRWAWPKEFELFERQKERARSSRSTPVKKSTLKAKGKQAGEGLEDSSSVKRRSITKATSVGQLAQEEDEEDFDCVSSRVWYSNENIL